jgi:hypothetical protein
LVPQGKRLSGFGLTSGLFWVKNKTGTSEINMLTLAFFILVVLALLVVLSGFTDAAFHIFSFLSRRSAVPAPPVLHFVSARSS